jgi:hypothetical protein
MVEFAKGLRLTVKKIFDERARVGIRADDPQTVILRPARQVPVTDILTCQKIEIGLNARVKREVFEALGYNAIGDRRACLPVVQQGSNVGLVMGGDQSGFASPKIDAG